MTETRKLAAILVSDVALANEKTPCMAGVSFCVRYRERSVDDDWRFALVEPVINADA